MVQVSSANPLATAGVVPIVLCFRQKLYLAKKMYCRAT